MNVCKNCGWSFPDKYCPRCGNEFINESESGSSDVTLSSFVTDEDREAEIRKNLWSGMHSNHVDTAECVRLAEDLLKYVPEDYYAKFVIAAGSENEKALARFLDNSKASDIEMYADSVLTYVCAHMTVKLYYVVLKYKDRSPLKESSEYEAAIERHAPYSVMRKKEATDCADTIATAPSAKKREIWSSVDRKLWQENSKMMISTTVLLFLSILCSFILPSLKVDLAVALPVTLTLFVAAVVVFVCGIFFVRSHENSVASRYYDALGEPARQFSEGKTAAYGNRR